ncbi:hypothetical protein AGMMS50267_13170 [Spirochaetia bacterium]|nr:hypothetical protein AGMMS50267_13170 [Spirochaetia bacterium]
MLSSPLKVMTYAPLSTALVATHVKESASDRVSGAGIATHCAYKALYAICPKIGLKLC